MLHTNPDQLERFLGADQVAHISAAMRDWYGPPIHLGGVRGKVLAHGGGDFTGKIKVGREVSAMELAYETQRRIRRGLSLVARRHARGVEFFAGFASLDEIISAATAGGKQRRFAYQKTGSTSVAGGTNSLWRPGVSPPAGAAGSAAPGGRAPTDATTGGFTFTNPGGTDRQHFVSGSHGSNQGLSNLLLYDRIFDVAKTMNSTATEAVTGVPSRYQNTTGGADDSIEGNFLFVEGFAALPATAHNWTVCTYKDQADAASTLPSLTGNASNIIDRLDHPVGQWFAPLATDDTGVKALTQMQCSAAVATGSINFVIGHPIAWLPTFAGGVFTLTDGIFTMFNMSRIFDDACLSFLDCVTPLTSPANHSGEFITVSG